MRRVLRSGVAAGVLAAVVFAVVALATLNLKHLGERGVQAERDLQGVVTELRAQDALEWRAISGRVSPQEVAEQVAASRVRAGALTTRAGGDQVRLAELTALQDTYARAVDEELRLLSAGEDEAAEEFDEAEVDPAFEAALQGVEAHGARVSAVAARARWLSDAGVVVTVVLSLALTTAVQSRRRRADVQRQAERRGEARYRALVDQASDLVLVTDRDGRAHYLSPSAERLLAGRGAGDDGVDLAQLVHPGDVEALLAALRGADGRGAAPAEIRVPGEQALRTFEISVQDLTDHPAVGGLVLTARDVTVRQALQREMEHRALHDTLTGLPNRALLADRFDQALRGAQRDGAATALLLIDLDRFKEINDTLGHHFGDELLVQIGPRLAGVLRQSDTVARLGGDEFAVLLPEIAGLPEAEQVAQKLQEALNRSFVVEGVDLDVEASIGVVLSGEHGQDAATLMQRADIAMYAAKQHNLGVATYDPDTDAPNPERLALLGDLRRALRDHELFLHYQPKVSLDTGQVCGAEALLRWAHPERGLIPPDAFIPLAENTGLIGPLTTRVLDLALRQTRCWVDAGQPLQVAVNLSARNLLDDRLEVTVGELLTRHGVDPALLKLEVTESAIMTDPVRATALLKRLHTLGVVLSIDDFGAGYTSLGQLKNLPVTELKVDRSFVMSMESDSSSSLIVRSVVELGHNLGLSAVAEGVENADILATLTRYSCDVAQGYHLSHPLTAAAFDQWRATWPGLPHTPREPAVRTARPATVHAGDVPREPVRPAG